ncbi:substrate-binding protein [Nocardioides humi]|uniref:Substrate-binding protein n=1 Tax=Nocardioides humi TaxID=449461 RepID=A0ABN2AZQ6_9ACTN
MPRRRGAVCALLAVAALLAAGCGAASRSSEADGDTVVVGLIPPTTGALAQFGTDTVAAWRFAAEQVNADGGVDGRTIEIKVYETDGSVDTTIREARRAVTQDGVSFLGAVMTGPENQALNAQLEGLGALNFNATGNDDELTGEDCSPNAFRSVTSASMDLAALARQVAELPERSWAVLAVDYSIGHSASATFTEAVEAAGGEVVETRYAPLGTTDFGTHITQLKQSGAEGLFVVTFGSDAVAFAQQGEQYRLFDRFDDVLTMNMVSEPLFDVIGGETEGFWSNVNYDVGADNALNEAFVAAWTDEFGDAPYYVEANTYLAAQMLVEGIRAADSTDPAQVREALSGLAFDSIAGPVRVREEDHQLLRPAYVGRVQATADGAHAFDIVSEVPPEQTTPQASPDCRL